MREYSYRLVNVFAESIFGGNPLCVFENGAGLSDAEMQSLALQFNLSETTFLLPSTTATARVRIFTPTFEMAFAGHPTLGSSHVVRELLKAGDKLTLEMKVGVIPVTAKVDRWTLKAAAPSSRLCEATRDALAAALGLRTDDVLEGARWVNTGSEQLIVPLTSADAVQRVAPKVEKLAQFTSEIGRSMAYVFAPNGKEDGNEKILSRFFFMKHDSIIEDPGTGSATANLGGWMLAEKKTPCKFGIEQGAAVGRPCHLGLEVDASGGIFVSGNVIEIGRGVIRLP
jgi:trans-2,3-dihydro-3-hydroxyanthranilate isomerase